MYIAHHDQCDNGAVRVHSTGRVRYAANKALIKK